MLDDAGSVSIGWYIEADTNGHHFADDLLKWILLYLFSNIIDIRSEKSINTKASLFWIIVWCQITLTNDGLVFMHICVTWSQLV